MSFKIFENLRNWSFWGYDFLKGSPIKKHWLEIKSIINDFSTEITQNRIEELRNEILIHAINTTPFYSKINSLYLDEFPVINKSIIKSNFQNFQSNQFLNKKVYKVITSGSTGTPFEILQDVNKKKRNTADTLFFAHLAGFNIGEQLVYLKIWNKHNQKSTLKAWIENIKAFDVTHLSDKKIMFFFEQLQNNNSNKGILGYASALEAISIYLSKNNKDVSSANVNSIITMSEALDIDAQKIIQKIFNVPVFSRYSNVENGIIAQQTPYHENSFLINTASYIVEILHMDEDTPAPNGTVGRIVITDLFNFAMPLIRYDTGDVGVLEMNTKLPLLKNIHGRRMDSIYTPKGELMSPFIITNSMWNYPELNQYQFIQKKYNEYIFKLNISSPFDKENELINEFKVLFGEDANFKVEYVNEIPLLDSGKRKKVVNLMANPNN